MRRLPFAALAIIACSKDRIAHLGLPPFGTAKTAIVGIDDRDAPGRVIATETASFEIAIPEPRSGVVELFVVGLDPSLEELGLEDGPIPDQTGRSIALVDVDDTASFGAMYKDGAWTDWAALDDVPSLLAGVRLPLRGCSENVDVMVDRLETGGRALLAAPIDEEHAIVVAGERVYIWSIDDGVVRSAALPFEPITGWVESRARAHLAAGSALYALDLGTLASTFTASAAQRMGFGTIAWMDAFEGVDPRLTALATGGAILRFEGGRWAMVAEIDPIDAGIDFGGVLATSRDEVLIGADNHADLYRFDGVLLSPEVSGGLDAKGFAAMAEVRALGPVAVELRSGIVFARSDGRWGEIGATVTEARIVHPIGDRRFSVSDAFGRWEEFHPVHGFGCGVVESQRLGEVLAIFQIRDSIFGVGLGETGLAEIVQLARAE